jgi:hypothetical protein
LLGLPYVTSPLVGGPDTPERLVERLNAFDCVTFVESVLALARCRSADGFSEELARLRYHEGRVEWLSRNHYMTLWAERNAAAGCVRILTGPGLAVETRPKRLDALPGYPPLLRVPRYLPRDALLACPWHDGDVALFASTRADLDFFHVGLLFPTRRGPLLRHASRSRGGVIEEPLAEFLERNETPGLLGLRPLPHRGALP